jgi:hypothetical protein
MVWQGLDAEPDPYRINDGRLIERGASTLG